MDWTDDGFAAIFILFMLSWTACSLWQYLILYWLGALTNDPIKASHYSGIWRGVLAAGEAIIFGVDSLLIPFEKEAAILFTFFTTGILISAYLAMFFIQETLYFKEMRVVVRNHILEKNSGNDSSPAVISETCGIEIEGNSDGEVPVIKT